MSLYPSGDGSVLVRLSAVPLSIRVAVADEIVRRGRLRGFDAAFMFQAAHMPVEDPQLRVSAEKAHKVLVEGRRPLGESPKVWDW